MTDPVHQAAAALYRKVGHTFTLDMLAKETGLSRATLYRRIGSKEDLIEYLATRGLIDLADHAGTDERVLDAARRVVAEVGFLACTMEQIALEAGIGVATLYRHFKDRQSLLSRLAAEPAARPVIRQPQAFGETGFETELRQLIGIGLRYGAHNRDAVRAVLSASKAEEPLC
ncbi:MAG: helix-turn-helix domain-containing protein [Pseudomonadota bacterium]